MSIARRRDGDTWSNRHGGNGGTAHHLFDRSSYRGAARRYAHIGRRCGRHLQPGDDAEMALVAHADPMIGPLDGPGGPNDTVAPWRPRHARLSLEWGHSPVRNAYRDILLFLYSFGDAAQHDSIPRWCRCVVSEVLYRAAVRSPPPMVDTLESRVRTRVVSDCG